MVRKILLLCGILYAVLYIGVDAVAASMYDGYSYTSQAISELSAIGAPTQGLMSASGYILVPLLFAFPVGVWLSANGQRSLRIAAIFLFGIAVNAVLWSFSPMSLREAEKGLNDVLHQVHAVVAVTFVLLAIGFGSGTDGKWFRWYSIATIVALLVCGVTAGFLSRGIDAGQPTPWMGLTERINVFGFNVWMAVMALVLWRAPEAKGSSAEVTPALADAPR